MGFMCKYMSRRGIVNHKIQYRSSRVCERGRSGIEMISRVPRMLFRRDVLRTFVRPCDLRIRENRTKKRVMRNDRSSIALFMFGITINDI